LPSDTVGVGQPESAMAWVRRTEARRRKRDTPEGVTQGFHVSLYKVEPSVAVTACNLLAKDALRAALGLEPVEGGPKVPLVSKPISFACRAERLAWAGTGPDGAIIRPTRTSQGIGPDSGPGEEMALPKPGKVIWSYILDAPFVDDAGRDMAIGDKLAQGRRCERVDLVVISLSAHNPAPPAATPVRGELAASTGDAPRRRSPAQGDAR
jgi:hypothetical protein